ncbi:MAG: hypothetical protein LUG59_10565 [Enterocloster clostridioformis]|nr:hypothetical protein [Enterocloster clostridioformis]
MKRLLKVLIITIMVMNLVVMTAIAAPYDPDKYTSVDIESELLAPGIKSSRVTELPRRRGVFFSAADLIISDEGNGDIGVFAKAYMEVSVEEDYITIYLDRWDKDMDRWRQVTFYDAEFYLKDYPNGITEPEVNMIFKNQPKGYYYRLRGVFGAILDENFEGFSPSTAGILIK